MKQTTIELFFFFFCLSVHLYLLKCEHFCRFQLSLEKGGGDRDSRASKESSAKPKPKPKTKTKTNGILDESFVDDVDFIMQVSYQVLNVFKTTTDSKTTKAIPAFEHGATL